MTPPKTSAEELLSERFDCDTELNELPAEEDQLLTNWSQLGADIRQIPIAKIDLVDAVNRELTSPPVTAETLTASTSSERRSESALAVVASFATVMGLCIGLLLVPSTGKNAAIQQHVSSTQLATGLAHCDIVVVTRPDGIEKTADWLKTSLVAHGMESHSIHVASDSSASQGSRLVVADAEPEDLLSLMNSYDNEFNPSQIDEMKPDELLSLFVESLETPSLAEEHFDEFVVVMPRGLLKDIASNPEVNVVKLAETSSKFGTNMTEAAIPGQSTNARPILFVIRRRKADVGTPAMDGARLEHPQRKLASPV